MLGGDARQTITSNSLQISLQLDVTSRDPMQKLQPQRAIGNVWRDSSSFGYVILRSVFTHDSLLQVTRAPWSIRGSEITVPLINGRRMSRIGARHVFDGCPSFCGLQRPQ